MSYGADQYDLATKSVIRDWPSLVDYLGRGRKSKGWRLFRELAAGGCDAFVFGATGDFHFVVRDARWRVTDVFRLTGLEMKRAVYSGRSVLHGIIETRTKAFVLSLERPPHDSLYPFHASMHVEAE